jgi:hypothetical protein
LSVSLFISWLVSSTPFTAALTFEGTSLLASESWNNKNKFQGPWRISHSVNRCLQWHQNVGYCNLSLSGRGYNRYWTTGN